jgi:hypothetical protein
MTLTAGIVRADSAIEATRPGQDLPGVVQNHFGDHRLGRYLRRLLSRAAPGQQTHCRRYLEKLAPAHARRT